jgi:hypothetical protein
MLSLHGKNYLLVRQLTIGGRKVTVRSEHGLLIHERPAGAPRSRSASTPPNSTREQSDKTTQPGSEL